jgi:hypothetical protein
MSVLEEWQATRPLPAPAAKRPPEPGPIMDICELSRLRGVVIVVLWLQRGCAPSSGDCGSPWRTAQQIAWTGHVRGGGDVWGDGGAGRLGGGMRQMGYATVSSLVGGWTGRYWWLTLGPDRPRTWQ